MRDDRTESVRTAVPVRTRSLVVCLLVAMLMLLLSGCSRPDTKSVEPQPRRLGLEETAQEVFGERLREIRRSKNSDTWYGVRFIIDDGPHDRRGVYRLFESMTLGAPEDAVFSILITSAESSTIEPGDFTVDRLYYWNRSSKPLPVGWGTLSGHQLVMDGGRRRDAGAKQSSVLLRSNDVDDAFMTAVANGEKAPPEEKPVKSFP